MPKKSSMGRQKIKIAKIEIKNHLQVTFSKCRLGLFKKASELCTLCGVEITMIVFSPAGKAFSFGHPNVESIIHKFLTPNSNFYESPRINATPLELNMQLGQILDEVEMERKKGEIFDNMRGKNVIAHYWWEANVNELGLVELEQLKIAMEELKKIVCQQISAINDQKMNLSTNVDLYENKPSRGGVGSIDGRVNSSFGYNFHGGL